MGLASAAPVPARQQPSSVQKRSGAVCRTHSAGTLAPSPVGRAEEVTGREGHPGCTQPSGCCLETSLSKSPDGEMPGVLPLARLAPAVFPPRERIAAATQVPNASSPICPSPSGVRRLETPSIPGVG